MEGGASLLVTALLGLCLGSFATALAHRLPRGISMVTKAHSACPACGHDLGLRDLVPVFSWLLLQGKCRYCAAPVGSRYPLIECATVMLCLAFYFAYGFTPQAFALFALAPVLAAMIAIDLAHKIIPDSLNLAVLALGIAAFALGRPDAAGLLAALEGAALYAGAAWMLRFVFFKILKREPMGLGDVKFFGAAGFWLGLDPDAAALFMILSGASGIVLALVWRRATGDREFPFGPALVLAFAALLVWVRPFSS
jgi:leader peptidase (prepilin peptidase)/N-methyltransferase